MQIVVKPFAPTIDPSSAAGDNGPKSEGLFGYVPVGGLVDFDCRSEFAQFVAVFVARRSKVVPFVFRYFVRVFAEPRTNFSEQHALKGAGLYLGDQFVVGRVAEVLFDTSHCVVIPF